MSFRQIDSRSRPEPPSTPRGWMVGSTVVLGTLGAIVGGIGSLNRLPTDVAGMAVGVAGFAILGAVVGVVCGFALIDLVRLRLKRR